MSGLGRNWAKYWGNRKINWKTSYFDTWDHPHRKFIIRVLQSINWVSLFEVGCGAGANFVQIVKNFPIGKQLGGQDINKDAIETAKIMFNHAILKIGPSDDIMMSDNSTDVILTDRCLMYLSPIKIGKTIEEIKRVSRGYVVFAELHSTSWVDRIKLFINSGYYAHNYLKLLEKHGFYDIISYKTPREYWPQGEKLYKFDHIILAKVPTRK